MTNDTPDPDIAQVHQLLLDAFTVEELDRLFRFSSNLELKKVAREFSPGDGLTIRADKAISYCQRHLLLPDLLAEVRRANPRQYDRFLGPQLPVADPDEPHEAQPAGRLPQNPSWGFHVKVRVEGAPAEPEHQDAEEQPDQPDELDAGEGDNA